MFHAFVCLVCVNYMAMKIPPDILINFIAVDVDRACEQREERNEDRTSDAGWLFYCCAPFLSLLTMCDCGVSCSFGGGVVVVVVWHIIRPVSMWSRNAESQCHSVLRYANLSLAQSYRSLRQWPFRISRSLQFNERFYRKCSINLFLHTHDRWIFELMMDETAIVPMIMAIYCNFLFPKMHSMTAGNAGTS